MYGQYMYMYVEKRETELKKAISFLLFNEYPGYDTK